MRVKFCKIAEPQLQGYFFKRFFPLRPARLGPRSRSCRGGIVGPGMSRIAPFHLGLDRRPGSLPKVRKIARDLDGPVRRREQMKCERQLAACDRRMARQAKQLLHADVEGRRPRRLVVDGVTIARGRLEMRRSLFLQAPLQGPWQQGFERRVKVTAADLGEFRLIREVWGKPLRGRPGKRLVGEIWPLVLTRRAQETDPMAELDLRFAPRQAVKSPLRDAFGQKTRRFLTRHHSERLACEHNGVEPADTARPERACTFVEVDLVFFADALACGGRHVRFIGFGGNENACRRRRSRQLGCDEVWRSRQGMRRIKIGAAAVGEEELAGLAARLADALPKGERQHARDR